MANCPKCETFIGFCVPEELCDNCAFIKVTNDKMLRILAKPSATSHPITPDNTKSGKERIVNKTMYIKL